MNNRQTGRYLLKMMSWKFCINGSSNHKAEKYLRMAKEKKKKNLRDQTDSALKLKGE